MARPIRIPIVSDVSGVLRGTNDVERALDDVADSLDDVSREAQRAGQDAGRELADGFEQGMRLVDRVAEVAGEDAAREFEAGLRAGKPADVLADDFRAAADRVGAEADGMAAEVEGATERMERSFRDAFDSIPNTTRPAMQRTAQDVDDTASRTRASMRELGDEARQNAAETFSSFDGSARSFADGLQGTLGGIVGSLGPLGAAIGAAGAAGVGLVVRQFDRAGERAEALRERVRGVLDSLNEIRDRGGSALDPMIDRLYEMADAAGEGDESLARLREDAEGIEGLSFEGLAQGLAGDADALDEAADRIRDYRAVIEDELLRAIRLQDTEGETRWARERDRVDDLIGKTEEEAEARRRAAEERAALEAAGIQELIRRQEAEEEAAAARQAAVDEYLAAGEVVAEREAAMQAERVEAAEAANQRITESVLSLSEAYGEVRNDAIEDGEITASELIGILDQQLADQNARIEAWAWAQENLTARQRQVLLDMGEDGFLALQGLINATPELRADALARLTTVGERKASAEVDGYERGIPDTVPGPNIVAGFDGSAIERGLARFHGMTIPINFRGTVGRTNVMTN
ncbi:hypothetical protein [Jiangella gansuensis]|uniref:hypothetical protein n=1 Tax=Jiangella gansuensis TaxID=281473 RepID=UPI000478F1DE|nr:hypothetical protein [Jiangella gansuensis]